MSYQMKLKKRQIIDWRGLEAENAEDWGWLSKGRREVEAATGVFSERRECGSGRTLRGNWNVFC